MPPNTLSAAAAAILETASPEGKVTATRSAAAAWRSGAIETIGGTAPPARPARPPHPLLLLPRDMPKRRHAGTSATRVALLHALAHIELNAIDLAWDIIARFTATRMPQGFYDDWVRVADEEALHFDMLTRRLAALGAAYGDHPAHDGLWQAAEETAHDLAARLAIVPMVLEARGLDVTPSTIAHLRRAGDEDSATLLQTIYEDEITHVAAGTSWFEHLCAERGLVPEAAWRDLVRRYFRGSLKPPFNAEARVAAGFGAGYWEGI